MTTTTRTPAETKLDAVIEALASAGYDVSGASTAERLIVAVGDAGDCDPDAEAALDEIRGIVAPLGCDADWTGSGDTDARGHSTSDIRIEIADARQD